MKFDAKFDTAQPYIACFVILRKQDKIAVVLRKNTGWMDGFYGVPAGKVEWQERYINGAVREAKEEAGVDILPEDLTFAHVCHRHSEDGDKFMDWVDVFFVANKWTGEPYNAEPEKSERLDWIDVNNLPDNVIPVLKFCLDKMNNGEFYSEYGWPS